MAGKKDAIIQNCNFYQLHRQSEIPFVAVEHISVMIRTVGPIKICTSAVLWSNFDLCSATTLG